MLKIDLNINGKQKETANDFVALKSIEAARFINLDSAKLISDYITTLSGTFFYISNGKVSSYQLLNYFLDRFNEPANVHITTWGFTELALRQLANRKNAGHIKDLYFVFSDQVKVNKANEYQLATSIATAYKKHPCHAKIYLIGTKDFQVTITTSGNLNRNNKLESGTICFNENIYKGYADYLNNLING
jgi:hypothetical protein